MKMVAILLVKIIKPLLNALVHFLNLVIFFIHDVFYGNSKILPPIDNNLLLMSATSLAMKIRFRKIKCEDVVRAYVSRAKAVQPSVNAITDARYEEAIDDARKVDVFLDRREKSPEQIEKETPLLGVPFSSKEVMGIKGLLQTAGLYKDKGRVAEEDADAPATYRKAGGIPLTVTNVPQLCMSMDTWNVPFGRTKNPYDYRKAAGGSSGGEAALIASAGAVVGIGTDLGGSIRIPSAFNGVYGHKPSAGVVSNRGNYPRIDPDNAKFNYIHTTGPMCRYAEDLSLLLKILTNNNPKLQLQNKVDFHQVKIYYMEEFPVAPAIPAVKQRMQRIIQHFEVQYGTKAQLLVLDELKNGLDYFVSKFQEANPPLLKKLMVNENEDINLKVELLKCLFGLSKHTSHAIFFGMVDEFQHGKLKERSLKLFDSIERKFNDIFEEEALLFLPTYPETAPFSNFIFFKFPNFCFCPLFNFLGFPATSIPVGLHNGMPIGIQAVSKRYNDRLTIAAALELEKLFGGWKSPCPITVK